jgi:hypothetical protein
VITTFISAEYNSEARQWRKLAWPRRGVVRSVDPARRLRAGDLVVAFDNSFLNPLLSKDPQITMCDMVNHHFQQKEDPLTVQAETPQNPPADSSCTSDTPLFRSLKALPQDPSGRGFSHLAMDGVWRTFDKDRNVLGYYVLNPDEIAEVLTSFPLEIRERFEKELVGVDGHNVTDPEKLMNPSEKLLPPAEEHKRAIEADMHEVEKRSGDGSWEGSR